MEVALRQGAVRPLQPSATGQIALQVGRALEVTVAIVRCLWGGGPRDTLDRRWFPSANAVTQLQTHTHTCTHAHTRTHLDGSHLAIDEVQESQFSHVLRRVRAG